jgi:sigma-E factor negative regulatory protein RseA|tara:strand:- start:200 stop:925 length:726 start_codon:yes stop_codon:yes gene_type:complete
MSDHENRLNESLSALMDSEANDIEIRRILKELDANDSALAVEIRGKWRRYHLASAVISKDNVSTVDYSIAVSDAIDSEVTHKMNPLTKIFSRSGILAVGASLGISSAGPFAVAASVALVAVLGVQNVSNPLGGADQASQFAQSDKMMGENSTGPANQFPAGWQLPVETQARTVSASGFNGARQYPQPIVEVKQVTKAQYSEQEVRLYLADILAKHSSHAALNSNQSMLPFARIESGDAVLE